MTSAPTISVSLNDERRAKVMKILRVLRNSDEGISRSEAIGLAIDHFFLTLCLTDTSDDVLDRQSADDIPA